jgi:hypothetical protein
VIYKKGMPVKSVDNDDAYENAMVYYDYNRVIAVFQSCVADWRTELNGIFCSDIAEKVKKLWKGLSLTPPSALGQNFYLRLVDSIG